MVLIFVGFSFLEARGEFDKVRAGSGVEANLLLVELRS